ELLANVEAGFYGLDSRVQLTAEGELRPRKAPGELFARFQPTPQEPIGQELARRAFGLVQRLEADLDWDTPTTLTVFRLYCMEGLSAARIARKCFCSKSAVMRRLKVIRAKLGTDPREMRAHSAHLEKIEEDIAASKARRVHRKAIVYGGDSEDMDGD